MPEDYMEEYARFRIVEDQEPMKKDPDPFPPQRSLRVMPPPKKVSLTSDSPGRIPTPPPKPKTSRTANKEAEEPVTVSERKDQEPTVENILANEEVDNLDVASLIVDSITAAAAIAFAVLLAQDMLPHL
ncbi:MAG: hypothetical protein AAGH40_06345 [Verrucomicrobiota bacterium]